MPWVQRGMMRPVLVPCWTCADFECFLRQSARGPSPRTSPQHHNNRRRGAVCTRSPRRKRERSPKTRPHLRSLPLPRPSRPRWTRRRASPPAKTRCSASRALPRRRSRTLSRRSQRRTRLHWHAPGRSRGSRGARSLASAACEDRCQQAGHSPPLCLQHPGRVMPSHLPTSPKSPKRPPLQPLLSFQEHRSPSRWAARTRHGSSRPLTAELALQRSAGIRTTMHQKRVLCLRGDNCQACRVSQL
jgi:hypothetical protein